MSTNVKNMTAGSPAKLIILFAIPLMLGNVCQQLYTMVDSIIVGKVVGIEALAALGAVDWLLWLVQGIITGMTQGFSILIAQYYGGGESGNLKKSVAYSYVLTAIIAVVTLVVSHVTLRPVLLFLNTPADVIDTSALYLRIIFSGLPIIAAYNIFAAVLRAMRNSRTPLIAMLVASCINIVLDLLFVAGFHWGVAGAAVATLISQIFSAAYCLAVIRKIDQIRLSHEDFKISRGLTPRLLKLGIPIAFQNTIIAVGGLTVQYVVNGYGFLFMAGFTATNKLYGIYFVEVSAWTGATIILAIGYFVSVRRLKSKIA